MRDRNPALLRAALLTLTATALALPAVAHAAEGPYFGLKAAGISTEDSEADGVDIEYDTGFGISGQVGYQFDIFRLEGEFGYQGLEGLSDTGVNSDVDIGRFTLNGYVDLPIAPNVGPYVGGGFGVANLSARDDFDDEDTAFTWHAEAGLNVNLTDQFVLSPFYRYQWIDTDLGLQSEALTSHLFGVSLRYLLTWHGRSHGGDRYYNQGYDSGVYGSGYTGYRSYDRYDRYDRHYHDDYYDRDDKKKSPEAKERDRCGWKGPGCEDEESEDWKG
ncbi:MAG: porin family protein [Alphaproteobacteria bacterium]